jgi:hypothetical protein
MTPAAKKFMNLKTTDDTVTLKHDKRCHPC